MRHTFLAGGAAVVGLEALGGGALDAAGLAVAGVVALGAFLTRWC